MAPRRRSPSPPPANALAKKAKAQARAETQRIRDRPVTPGAPRRQASPAPSGSATTRSDPENASLGHSEPRQKRARSPNRYLGENGVNQGPPVIDFQAAPTNRYVAPRKRSKSPSTGTMGPLHPPQDSNLSHSPVRSRSPGRPRESGNRSPGYSCAGRSPRPIDPDYQPRQAKSPYSGPFYRPDEGSSGDRSPRPTGGRTPGYYSGIGARSPRPYSHVSRTIEVLKDMVYTTNDRPPHRVSKSPSQVSDKKAKTPGRPCKTPKSPRNNHNFDDADFDVDYDNMPYHQMPRGSRRSANDSGIDTGLPQQRTATKRSGDKEKEVPEKRSRSTDPRLRNREPKSTTAPVQVKTESTSSSGTPEAPKVAKSPAPKSSAPKRKAKSPGRPPKVAKSPALQRARTPTFQNGPDFRAAYKELHKTVNHHMNEIQKAMQKYGDMLERSKRQGW
ncbi:hypothetical protein L596_025401 [Steinernema carpocapsae]|uniref:Uncharacterized protein n=1 Tax=Steinernema carpocapsae TaxID=34508 RepID=A0A4U5M7N3_STECR|nr:hypothetical protein L596_025401 [Steinernema carpocapsae]